MALPLQLPIDGGLLESVAQLAVTAGTVVLFLMLVALAGYAYKSFRGDGIRWPDDVEEEDDGAVRRGNDDDEWKYY